MHNFLKDFFDVMLDTEEFLHRIKSRGNASSLLYFGFILLSAFLINIILLNYDILPAGLMPFEQIMGIMPGIGVHISALYFLIGFLFVAFYAALLSSLLGIMGTKTSFRDSLRTACYGLTPSMVTLWIPVLGILLTLWSLYLIAMGLGVVNKAPLKKNLKASLIAGVIVAVFMVVFLLEIGLYLLYNGGGNMYLLWSVLLPGFI